MLFAPDHGQRHRLDPRGGCPTRGLLYARNDSGHEAQAIAANVHVRMQSVNQPVGSLSGGNQQRAIFGRAFATHRSLLLLDEPTRGVDVGAKAEIYELIERAAADGMAVLVASSELEELQLICHRIAVMNHGSSPRCLSSPGRHQRTHHVRRCQTARRSAPPLQPAVPASSHERSLTG